MIRVRIELCPLGDERPEAVREIGRMYIANDGEKSVESAGALGDYRVAVCRRGSTGVPKPINPKGKPPVRGGEIRDYPRLALSVWRLIARALHVSFPEETTPAKRKSGDRPVLDAAVLRGLRAAMEQAKNTAAEWAEPLTSDEQAANEWLDAANRTYDKED